MRSESDSRFPLADLTVVDFSQVLAGPYAGRLFADLGANVIKIESPAGDLSRRIAPRRDRGMSGLYTWANAGKRNVCIDLAQDERVVILTTVHSLFVSCGRLYASGIRGALEIQ